ncbi:MAG: UTRA domain-containing protein [Streptosporangiaceae bacterium]|nr:UTRA domain-containing protein [Streptosporangiaceae bacterium]MBV9858252.1 UTRA domain-containing protein [Streptosporangiaceae bacterium]
MPAQGSAASEQDGPLAATDSVPAPRAAVGVLADRMAAALVHREPGWRLPRRSALARRYSVSIAEIDAAIAELARRSLIRRLPDGQLYRASPAEYLIPVEGVPGFGARLDPMGSQVICQARHVSQRGAPQDIAWALGLPSGAAVRIVRCVWTSGSEPAAISTAYLPEALADAYSGPEIPSFGGMLHSIPVPAVPAEAGRNAGDSAARGTGRLAAGAAAGPAAPGAGDRANGGTTDSAAPGRGPGAAYPSVLDLELAPPQPSVARSLRLVPGQPAITVTIRFDDPATARPAGLTVVILKPELFRVVVETKGRRAP